MLPSEAGAQRALLKWIVNLQGDKIKKMLREASNYTKSLRLTTQVKFTTYCNFPLEEVLERQTQTTDHFSQEQCIDAPFKH
jgi:hypothetical protein